MSCYQRYLRRGPSGRTGFALSCLLILGVGWVPPSAAALDVIQFQRAGEAQTVAGRIVVEAADGGLLLQTDDGTLWTLQPDEIVDRRSDERPFRAVDHDAMQSRLLQQLPRGFRVHATPNFLVAYNTSQAYARWTSSLLERLQRAFTSHWSRRGCQLREPEFPLITVVFADRRSYEKYARPELGESVRSIIGYYSMRTNRVLTYDLTGSEAVRGQPGQRGSLGEITQMLSRPAAAPLVATVVHEATHQIAFNCGLQTRYADIPLLVSEGLALYFESPNLKSRSGWQGLGGVNYLRLETVQHNLARGALSPLTNLLANDDRFRNADTAAAAYAEAWAWTYFLNRRYPQAYASYLQVLAEKKPFILDTPAARIAEFREAFGDDFQKLEAEFRRQVSKLK